MELVEIFCIRWKIFAVLSQNWDVCTVPTLLIDDCDSFDLQHLLEPAASMPTAVMLVKGVLA